MAPLGGNIYLTFHGIGFHSGHVRRFDVMVGDNPPTVTGGYATWNSIKRPLQRAYTQFTGYEPMQLTVDVRFGAWDQRHGWLTDDTDPHTGQTVRNVEKDIATLEWMAGSNFNAGPSPVVYLWSHSSGGGDTNLVPPQYATQKGVPWVVSGLQWGKSYRSPNGFRTLQEATITLLNYLNLSKPPAPDTTIRGGYFVSKPGRDTALLIAAAPSAQSPIVDHKILAQRILADDQNNPCKGSSIRLARRSVSWTIRHGTSVFVPQHQGL